MVELLWVHTCNMWQDRLVGTREAEHGQRAGSSVVELLWVHTCNMWQDRRVGTLEAENGQPAGSSVQGSVHRPEKTIKK